MTPWRWWAAELNDDVYSLAGDADTREAVIREACQGLKPGDQFKIVEARSSDDKRHEGSDCVPFLRTRNAEIITVGPTPAPRTDGGGCRMRALRVDILPISLPPLGVGREQAAALIGISPTMFDRCVDAGSMPSPRALGGRLLWDVSELTAAFRKIPHRGRVDNETLDEASPAGNPWD